MREPIDCLRSLKKYVAMALATDDYWEVRLAYEDGTFERPFCRVEAAGDAAETGNRYDGEIVMPVQILAHPREKVTADESILEAERVRSILRRAFRVGAGAIPAPTGVLATAAAGALPAGTYRYRVTTRTRFGESAPTTAGVLTLASTGGAHVTWNAVAGARAYRVYRGTVAGSERVMAEVLTPELVDDGTRNLGAVVRATGIGTLGQPWSVPLWDWEDVAFEASTTIRLEPDYMRVRGLTTTRIGDPSDPVRQSAVCAMRLAWRVLAFSPADRAPLTQVIVGQPSPPPPAPPGGPTSPPPGAPGAPEAPFDVVLGTRT
jgi:hypothetical protein